MYDPIFAIEDETFLVNKHPAKLEVLTLDSPDFKLSQPDAEGSGRLLVMVSTGSMPLTLADAHELRDALTEHLAGFPDPLPVPVAA